MYKMANINIKKLLVVLFILLNTSTLHSAHSHFQNLGKLQRSNSSFTILDKLKIMQLIYFDT